MSALAGRTYCITGTSRGLGRAVAEALLMAGADIIALARRERDLISLDNFANAHGRQAMLVPVDLRQPPDFGPLAAAITARGKPLDGLILNAATMGECRPVADTPPAQWQEVMQVNALSQLQLLGTLAPLLRAAPAARVVGILDDHMTGGYFGPYAAAKAALKSGLTAFAAENSQGTLRTEFFAPPPMATQLRAKAFPGEDQTKIVSPQSVSTELLKCLV
jgi:NAD(P)-dependent dehydrogenase (short-subunit alcohol dehydrogenase family)